MSLWNWWLYEVNHNSLIECLGHHWLSLRHSWNWHLLVPGLILAIHAVAWNVQTVRYNTFLPTSIFLHSFSGSVHSIILQGHPSYIETLSEYLQPVEVSGKPWRRCFRASEHRYSSFAFHSACDNKGPTVVVARVGSHVFGGYADTSWTCECCFLHIT